MTKTLPLNLFVDLSTLDNNPPGRSNSDDKGRHKRCHMNGLRARWSSAALKYAQTALVSSGRFGETVAEKTSYLSREIAQTLLNKCLAAEKPANEAAIAVEGIMMARLGMATVQNSETLAMGTKEAVLLAKSEIDGMSNYLLKNWDALRPAIKGLQTEKASKKGNGDTVEGKSEKKPKKGNSLSDFMREQNAKKTILLPPLTPSFRTAMFGRMMASFPEGDIDACSQHSHAIGTNLMKNDVDFFAATDGLQDANKRGAALTGYSNFSSNCFYRYSSYNALAYGRTTHLSGKDVRNDLAIAIKSALFGRPAGKTNSFANLSLPMFFMLTAVRDSFPVSLLNAFLEPVTTNEDHPDLMKLSIDKLMEHRAEMFGMYDLFQPSLAFSTYKFDVGKNKDITVGKSISEIEGFLAKHVDI